MILSQDALKSGIPRLNQRMLVIEQRLVQRRLGGQKRGEAEDQKEPRHAFFFLAVFFFVKSHCVALGTSLILWIVLPWGRVLCRRKYLMMFHVRALCRIDGRGGGHTNPCSCG